MKQSIAVFGTRGMKYAYSNARVKAMKEALLPSGTFEQMVAANTIRDVIGILERTDYKVDFSEPALRYSGADLVDFALGKHLVRKARKILSFTPPEALPAVLSVLEKWDVYNLKTILLAKHLGYPNKEIAPLLVPAGVFTEPELNRILERVSVEDVVSFIGGTGYGVELKPLIDNYKRTKNAQPLLNAVERHFYVNLSRSIPPNIPDGMKILALVKMEVDNRNIVNILRGKCEGAKEQEIRQYMIGGGRLSASELDRLIGCRSADEVVKAVCERYRLEGVAAVYKQTHSIVAVEIALERMVMEFGLKTLRTSVLSPGALIGYLYLKENEITNIRKILRGKEFGMSPEKIRETMVLVV